jgi:hypothetical protein
MRRTAKVLAAVALAAGFTCALAATPARAATAVSVWMAPGATGTGLTAGSPAGTFSQAQADLAGPLAGYTSATVNMKPGAVFHLATEVIWRMPDVTFAPTGYTGGGLAQVNALGGYPVLDGGNRQPVMFTVDDGVVVVDGETFGTAGTNGTGVIFRYLRFQHRGEGLVQVLGGTGDGFYGDVFADAGNRFSGKTGCGYGGLLTEATTRLTVSNSRFTDLVNDWANTYAGVACGPTHMHGVYLKASSNAVITGSTFTDVSAAPVKFRDGSSYSVVSRDTFTHTGFRGFIYSVADAGQVQPHGNHGSGNHWVSYYATAFQPDYCANVPGKGICPAAWMNITGTWPS